MFCHTENFYKVLNPALMQNVVASLILKIKSGRSEGRGGEEEARRREKGRRDDEKGKKRKGEEEGQGEV